MRMEHNREIAGAKDSREKAWDPRDENERRMDNLKRLQSRRIGKNGIILQLNKQYRTNVGLRTHRDNHAEMGPKEGVEKGNGEEDSEWGNQCNHKHSENRKISSRRGQYKQTAQNKNKENIQNKFPTKARLNMESMEKLVNTIKEGLITQGEAIMHTIKSNSQIQQRQRNQLQNILITPEGYPQNFCQPYQPNQPHILNTQRDTYAPNYMGQNH